jgi:Protein of unknown function (DUF3727)/Protein of unknown function (DUF1292)
MVGRTPIALKIIPIARIVIMSKAQENGYPQDEAVILQDEAGNELPCYIEHSVDVDGKEYVLLRPVDDTVEIFSALEDNEEEAFLVDDESLLDKIFPIAQAVLAERDLILNRSAYALTVTGEVPPPTEDDLLILAVEDEETNTELEPEQLQFLANFYHENSQYEIFKRLVPMLWLAGRKPTGELELLTPEEIEKVQPALDKHLDMLQAQDFDEE